MPGLCGILTQSQNVDQCIFLFRRVHTIEGLISPEALDVSDGAAIANYSLTPFQGAESQPGSISGSNAVLMLEGEIYNYRDLANRVSSNIEPTLCNVLLALFLDEGPDFVDRLDGEFNIVIQEARSRRITIINDHIASNPMYYWSHPKGFLYGSEKKALLAIGNTPRHIDPIGLLQPFVHHHNLEDRTFIEGLKRLPPATTLICDDGRVSTSKRVRTIGKSSVPANASAMMDEWKQRLQSATDKRIGGKDRLLFSLSAGLDSRAIACFVDRGKRSKARTDNAEKIFCVPVSKRWSNTRPTLSSLKYPGGIS